MKISDLAYPEAELLRNVLGKWISSPRADNGLCSYIRDSLGLDEPDTPTLNLVVIRDFKALLESDYSLWYAFPFNTGWEDYYAECFTRREAHLNPKRRAWVEKTVEALDLHLARLEELDNRRAQIAVTDDSQPRGLTHENQ